MPGILERDPIAVIGFDVRLPQDACSAQEFWTMLYEGRNANTTVPKERVNMDAFYHPNPSRTDTANVRSGNFITGDIAAFDAPFFSIQQIEAESMDPQQRLLLETSYKALENAGAPLDKIQGSKTSVYVAASTRDYEVILYRDPELTPKYMGTGIGTSLLANRISWFFDFRGPSITLDTACSSGLAAVHMACQSLKSKESNLAVVGGVSLILAPEVNMNQLSTLGFLSPDGRSYSFDSRANGYAKGEGVSVVVLKRLSDAIRDNDSIRGVIRGTTVNQDGRTPGITQPSKHAQTENILQAYKDANLDLQDTNYFEAHGTGTAIGDPLEAEAIHNAFQRPADKPLWIGTLKANIGHLEAAAGVASLIKAVLVLENGVLPPNADFRVPNPNIPIEKYNFKFLTKPIPFPADGLRRISINNFGYGGTNAHAIVDDALNYLHLNGLQGKHCSVTQTSKSLTEGHRIQGQLPRNEGTKSNSPNRPVNGNGTVTHQLGFKRPIVLPFSTADESGIARILKTYQRHFRALKSEYLRPEEQQRYLQNLSYTLSTRRSALPWKSFVVVDSIERLQAEELATLASKPQRSSSEPLVSFVFTGQGAQWFAMGRELGLYSVYRESLEKSEAFIKSFGCDWSLIDELNRDKSLSRINEPEFSQPLCTAIQIALVDLLESWNIRPTAVIGHSSGEIAAAYCAGGLSHKSAVQAAYYKGLLVSKLLKEQPNSGAMISVALSETGIQKYLTDVTQQTGESLVVGCVNSPDNVTVTGGTRATGELATRMQQENIFGRVIPTGIAYHSSFMDAISVEYASKLGDLESREMPGKAPRFFSSVYGKEVPAQDTCTSTYWVDNLVGQVKFSSALQDMVFSLLEERKKGGMNKSGRDIMIEIGPHAALQRPIKDTIKNISSAKEIEYNSTLERNVHAVKSMCGFAGRLRSSGVTIDILHVNFPDIAPVTVQVLTDLPAYPFNHETKYWVESRLSRNFRFRQHSRHELLGSRETDWNPLWPKWRNVIRLAENGWILDHQLDKINLYPASGMLVMAIEAARSLAGTSRSISAYRCSNVNFPAGLRISDNADSVEAQVVFNPVQQSGGGLPDQCRVHDFQIFAYFGEAWHELCYGTIEIEVSTDSDKVPETNLVNDNERSNKRWENVNSKEFYDTINEHGMSFGPAFQGLQEVRVSDRQATARIELDRWHNNLNENNKFPHTPHVIHPTDLDVIFQSSIASISQGGRLPIPVLIPTKIRSLWLSNDLLTRGSRNVLDIHNQIDAEAYREADFSIAVYDKHANKTQVRVDGLSLTFVKDAKWMERADEEARRTCWSLVWRPDPSLLTREELAYLCSSTIVNGENDGCLAAAIFVELFAHQNPLVEIVEAEDVPPETSRSIRDRLMNYGLHADDDRGLPLFRRYTITRSDGIDDVEDHGGPFSDRVERKAIDTEGDDEEASVDGLYDLLICHNRNYILGQSRNSPLSLLKLHGRVLCLDSFEILTKTDLDIREPDQALSATKTNGAANGATVSDSKIVILISPDSQLQEDVAGSIQAQLSTSQGISSTIAVFDSIDVKQYMGSHYISLLELDVSFFFDIKDEQWPIFKSILSTAKSLFWVTKGQTPDKDLVSGLGRVIQSEYLDLRFVELALETSTSTSKAVDHIASVFLKAFHTADDAVDFDSEYREQDGKLCIGRVREATSVNATIRSMVSPSRPKQQQLGADPQRALSLSIASPGLLNSLHFEDDPDFDLALGPTEVEIEVRATGMNFKDILIAMGQISGNRLGFECAGIVSRAGNASGFETGQRVTCCTLSGAYKTFVRADASWVFDLPDHIPFTDAAGIPLVFATAYYSLVEVARLSEGETVLIHSGAGGVGQAAIQIAQRKKARIFTTVGTEEKKRLLQDLYQIPESHIFSSRDTSFAQQVKTHCPNGVDVVLNSLRGELQEASWKCIAPLGRFVDVGKADFESSRKGLNMKPFLSNVSFSSVDLSVVMRNAKPTTARIMNALKSYLTESSAPITSPQPLQVYRAGNLQDAFRQMANGKSSGKIIVDMNAADEVPILPSQKPCYNFQPDATYVIAGGLGGLGRTLVDWMIERKARNFILLSRSGSANNEAAQKMIENYATEGIVIKAPMCDVANEHVVRQVFEDIAQTMPPIKGCIQGSMVLRDGLLDSMSSTDWNAVLRPKTQGTLNLAAHLPSDMDFFVLLSSISAVSGSRCQANYSAGNSFMDALARKLAAEGRRCLSLNLGVIKDVGIAAQLGTNAALRRDGFEGLSTPELLALLDYACDPNCPHAVDPQRVQLIAGLGGAMTLPPEHFESVYWTGRPIFRQLQEVNRITFQDHANGNGKSDSKEESYGRLFINAADEAAATEVALKGLVAKLASLLNVPVTDIEVRKPLHSFGIDSLVSLEIRYWISKELKAEVSIFDIMQASGLAELAGVVVENSELRK